MKGRGRRTTGVAPRPYGLNPGEYGPCSHGGADAFLGQAAAGGVRSDVLAPASSRTVTALARSLVETVSKMPAVSGRKPE